MSKKLAMILVALALLASCVGAPAPAPAPAPEPAAPAPAAPAAVDPDKARAMALVQGSMGGTTTPTTSGTTTPPAATTTTTPATGTTAPAPATTAADTTDVPPPPPGVMTPEEEAFLKNYLARLQYMVYYDEAAGISAEAAKIAINQANRYLLEKLGLSVIDFEQIERNKKDQQTAYQAETGGAIGIMQYLAQRYNADVYVEISFTATTSSSGGKYYATATGTMKLFDTSTATLLGSVAFQSPQVMNTTSVESAVANAVAASVWNVMPKMTEQAQMLVRNSLQRGIRFEVIFQKTPDSRQMSTFRRALAKVVREVEQVSYSPEETHWNVFTFKSRDQVEDAIYDAADKAGLMDLYLVYSRGKSFTFNTGL